jgi:NhaA family Na+:H+ antiporter
MQEFVHSSASSGIVLMLAALAALALANSPLADQYDALLHTTIGITAGPFELSETLLHWINDGLMAVFFFLVGLEIKREVVVGELSDLRAALLPIVAAVGGALVPALIYTATNFGGPGASGWGIPMATDIAFALGILALLGDRVPFALKVFVTAVAIVDDLIAVLVIALFYSGGVDFLALGIGLALLLFLFMANRLGIRTVLFYVVAGLVVWLAFRQSGIHATVAGVLVAMTIPARNRIDPSTFVTRARGILERFEQSPPETSHMLTDEVQQASILELEDACEAVQAPLQKMEHTLHKWVAFGIMPIFALANAGVALSPESVTQGAPTVPLGIILGLVLGKPVGLLLASWLAVRVGAVSLPQDVGWGHLVGAAFLAGVGFTMSLFIASLGFGEGPLLASAKLGILAASVIAGSVGYVLLRRSGTESPGGKLEY